MEEKEDRRMVKKKPKITEKIVELNSGTRKGKYLLIKADGKPQRHFKIRAGETPEAMKQYYIDTYIEKKPKGKISQYRKAFVQKETKAWKEYSISPALKKQAQTYLKKVSKRPKIKDAIRAGLTNVKINNILKATPKTIQKAHYQLLQDLVIDTQLLDTLTKPENTSKLKTRYENKIIIKDKKGKKITEAIKYNTTPEEIMREIQENFKQDSTIDYPERKLRELGYKVEGKTDKVTIGSISLEVTFRKGGKKK